MLPGQDWLIDEIGLKLAQNPKQKVTLVGSTEPLGSRAYSLAIASERVQKISNLLRKKGARQRQIIAYPVGYSSRLACTGKHCQPGSNARVLVVFSDE